MRISIVMGLLLGALLLFGGCGGDDDSGAADGGAGMAGDMGGLSGTGGAGAGGAGEGGAQAGAGTAGEAGSPPAAGTGGTAGTPPVAGEGAPDAAVSDGAAAMDGAAADAGPPVSECELLADCCDTIPVADRNACRSIADTGVEQGCSVYVPIYCTGTDGGTKPVDGGVSTACQELSACCTKQTVPMIVSVCESAVEANNDADCELLLTSGLEAFPFVEPCD